MHRIPAFLISLILLATINGLAFADSFEQSYKLIRPVQPTQSEHKIEVVEVFWYGCLHCYNFEPYLNKWLETKSEDVDFRRMPGIFNKSWIPHAKTYFTAIKMGVLEQIHEPLFHALHTQKRRLNSDDALYDFVTKLGVDGGEFSKIYSSNATETNIKEALVMGQRYRVTGVPSVVVNGKYLTSASLAGSYENMLKVVDKLVDRERKALKEK
ncbi:MAG: thiol:disulfide interchange protein DsbA/DsbL [Gammaproteobacteria bacterium]|nr:thiol:disulfide interchange protein DsbA/DsbL [Gammaproteobacteria bacterium]